MDLDLFVIRLYCEWLLIWAMVVNGQWACVVTVWLVCNLLLYCGLGVIGLLG